MPTLLSHTNLQATQVIAQPKLTKKYACPTPNDRQKSTGYNTRLASCGVKWLNSSAVFQLGFSAGLTVLYSEIPHERQAWER